MAEIKDPLRRNAAMLSRPRLAPRPLEELYRLPSQALITPAEASAVAQITETALAVRRTKGDWPRYIKFGRLVRYRLGDLITAPTDGGVS
jgi:hypothetical protein